MNKDELKKKIENIELELKPLRRELLEIETKESNISNKSMIGTCLMFQNNSYSCPSKPSDYWNNYYMIIDATAYEFTVLGVYKDSHGHISIQTNTIPELALAHGGYIRISKEKFNAEYDKLLGEIISIRVKL